VFVPRISVQGQGWLCFGGEMDRNGQVQFFIILNFGLLVLGQAFPIGKKYIRPQIFLSRQLPFCLL
jgi:hypothetical protein